MTLDALRRRRVAAACLVAFALWSARGSESLVVHEHTGGDRPHVHVDGGRHAHASRGHRHDHHPHGHGHPPSTRRVESRGYDHGSHHPHRPATRPGSPKLGDADDRLASHAHVSHLVRVAGIADAPLRAPAAADFPLVAESARRGWRAAPLAARPRAPPGPTVA